MTASNREREQWLRQNGWNWNPKGVQEQIAPRQRYWVYGATEIRVPMIYKEVYV